MDFQDPRWLLMHGGYRIPYDPRPALEKLKMKPDAPDAWEELLDELHHQGDVGEASYAAMPWLVECVSGANPVPWLIFVLASIIETARQNPYAANSGTLNPALPDWLKAAYFQSLEELAQLGLREFIASDTDKRIAIVSFLLAYSQRPLLADLCSCNEQEIMELLNRA